ncbi:MAG: ion channel [Acetobacteraceae bacterium]|nr:hypothetical protein [Pseudomonadota bacterium]
MPWPRPYLRARPQPVLQSDLGLFKIGATRFDLRDPYRIAVGLSWPAFTVCLLGAWLTLNLVFATLYVLSPGSIANVASDSFWDAFFFSIETLATVGYGVMAPVTTYAHVVSAVEIVVGMAFTAIVTGLMFVRFSRPRARFVYAENPVVTSFNDHRTLMIRLANGRMTVMTNANAKLYALIVERTAQARSFRRLVELPLLQSHLPVFVMPWTLMHAINETSPFFGYTAETFAAADVRLCVTLDARDQAIETTVYDVTVYTADKVRFGMCYADATSLDEQGHVIGDLSRISLLEPEAAEQPEWAQWVR